MSQLFRVSSLWRTLLFLVVAPLTISGLAITSQEATAGLVAHWDLEEGSGVTTTAAIGAPDANGTLLGASGWETHVLPPVIGGTTAAATFTGSPDAIATVFTGPLGSAARSITTWVRADPNQPNNTSLVSWGDNNPGNRFSFRLDAGGAATNGRLRLEIQGDFAIGNTAVNDGQWHHVAVVLPDDDPDGDTFIDLDDISMYVDGVLDADMTLGFTSAGGADSVVDTIVTAGVEVALGNSPHSLGAYGIVGGLDDVRIYDHALTPGEISAMVPPTIGAFGVTIDRQSGNLTLANTTTNGINFVAYSITSDIGALDPGSWKSIADNSDMDSGGSVDGTDNWVEFTPPTDRDDLSEGEQPGGNGVTLGMGDSIDLGNAWIQSATDDVQMVLLSDDGSGINVPVSYSGLEIPVGDMDFDGDVDALDWPAYRTGLFADLSALSGAEQYQMGDLDGDGDNDEDDFVTFKTVFDAQQGAGAFESMLASVPEPGGMVLLLLGGTTFLLIRRQNKMTTQSVTCTSRLTVALVLVVAVCGGDAEAAVLNWTGGGTDTTDFAQLANWSGTPTGGTIDTLDLVDDYVVDDATFSMTRGRLNFRDGGSFTFGQGSLIMTSGIGVTENPDTFGSLTINGGDVRAQFLAEINATLGGTGTLTMFGGGNPINTSTIDFTSSTFTLNMEAETVDAFTTEHLGKTTVFGAPAVIGENLLVVSDGGAGSIVTAFQPNPPLSLEVNTVSGRSKIINDTGSPIEFDFYKLTSASDSLDLAGWNSLFDQNLSLFPAGDGSGNGWEEAGGSNNSELGEAYLQGQSTLADEASLNLGSAFNQATGLEDIMLRYRDTDSGVFVDVEAVYTDVIDEIAGDYNDNQLVEQGDLDLVLLGWGSTTPGAAWVNQLPGLPSFTTDLIDQEELDRVLLNWGNSSAAASSVAVPEPDTGLMALLGLFVVGMLTIARSQGRSRMAATVVVPRISSRLLTPTLLLASTLLWSTTAMAASTLDRNYQFGDDGAENASAGNTVGTGSGNPNSGHTLDTQGTPGTTTFIDLEANGDPKYVNVDALGRPLATSGELGIEFDGTGDYLQGVRLGLPNTSISSVGGGGTLNYDGIVNRGYQFWVNPASAGNGSAQSLVADTDQHAVRISSTGTWELRYGGSDVDSGVAVNFDAWSHVMLVRPFGAANGAHLYVDGIAVAAEPGGYTGAEDTPLVVGSNTGDDVDVIPGSMEFFQGVMDDLEMFVLGVATTAPFPDYGTFFAPEDNAFIANALIGVADGDLTGDGLVTGDGSGSVTTDDVSAFIANWEAENLVNTVLVGDLNSRDLGDFNFDGIVDLFDWHVLRTEHVNGSNLDLGALLAQAAVPEPSSLTLLLLSGVALLAGRRRR